MFKPEDCNEGLAAGTAGLATYSGAEVEKLPDDILQLVFSKLNAVAGNESLHCMEVCKLWQMALPDIMSALVLHRTSRLSCAILHFVRFPNICFLKLDRCSAYATGWHSVFEAIGSDLKCLKILHIISVKPKLETADTTVLFHRCKTLVEIRIQNSLSSNHSILALDENPHLEILETESIGAINTLNHLPNLQKLSLRDSSALCSLPPLSNLTALQSIDLSYSFHLRKLPPLAGLLSLESLSLHFCTSLTEMPDLRNVLRLRYLNLCGCLSLRTLPGVENLSCLTALHLWDCPVLRPLPRLTSFPRLEKLAVQLSAADAGHQNLGQLTHLKDLQLDDAAGAALRGLPRSLEILSLTLPVRLRPDPSEVFPHLGHLTVLQTLDISASCRDLAVLGISGLDRLRTLRMRSCPFVSELLPPLRGLSREPTPAPVLKHLEALEFNDCTALTALPLPDGVPSLRKLNVANCQGLLDLPEFGIVAETRLETLKIMNISSMKWLPTSLGRLVRLRHLSISCCWRLTKVPELSTLPALETLDIQRGDNISELPPLGKLTALRELKLMICNSLRALPPLDGLRSLRLLKIIHLPALARLPPLEGLVDLKELHIHGCTGLTSLPSLRGLSSLCVLDLHGCHRLETVPPVDGLKKLLDLNLKGCYRLKKLPLTDGLHEALEMTTVHA